MILLIDVIKLFKNLSKYRRRLVKAVTFNRKIILLKMKIIWRNEDF
jgi:hypothetical protein